MSKKTMQVTLSFIADTKQAKKEVQNLAQQLSSLSTRQIQTSMLRDVSADAKQAAYDVGKFTSMLHGAINTNTGKLDLSKLNKSLKLANTDLSKVAQSFKALGSDGVRAFEGVVKQINAAEVPLKKTNALIDHLWDSMKKTVTWQISSSALHGLMSGVSGAMRYAQELNKSLTDIQIVTQRNTDQMAKFAIEANKAAKALSTTTGRYAEASLIYFQQGLNDQEIKERTDVTVKMTNVTRESAAEVSNQLTAIWNNFDNGSKSLEYYADVLTKLGATTASSTAEISGGLEKFAAIGNTIGLSYEYAASALATITSNTRQSEEVVGTALKTIFARIQGLNLGDTLDDGTTLNKYSEALNAVGISIFDQAGQIKTMDNILDEMSSKWGTMAKDQQIALAQTVAGVRQYTQLVALMDNWNSGDNDSMVANLNTAYNAAGALSEQAEIYANSWEAAQNRVRASWEELYDTLISDDFFIDLLDAGAKVLDIIDQMIKGFGGVSGLLSVISTYFISLTKTKLTDELIRLTGPSNKTRQEEARAMKQNANQELQNMANSLSGKEEFKIQAQTYSNIGAVQEKLVANNDKITAEQKKIIEGQLEQYRILSDIVAAKGKSLDATKAETKAFKDSLKALDRVQNRENRKAAKTAHDDAQRQKQQAALDTMEGWASDKATLLDIKNRKSQAYDRKSNSNPALSQNEYATVTALAKKYDVQWKDIWKSHLLYSKDTDGSYKGQDKNRETALNKIYKEIYAKIIAQEQSFQPPEVKEFDPSTVTKVNSVEPFEEYEKNIESISKITKALYGSKKQEIATNVKQVIKNLENENEKLYSQFIDGIEGSLNLTLDEILKGLEDIGDEERAVNPDVNALEEAVDIFEEQQRNLLKIKAKDTVATDEDVDAFADRILDEQMSVGEIERSAAELDGALAQINQEVDNIIDPLNNWQSALVSTVGAISALSMSLQTLGGLWDTLTDPNVSGWEKFTTVVSTLLTVIPGVIISFKQLKDAEVISTSVKTLNTLATKLSIKAKKEEAAASLANAKAQKVETVADKQDIAANITKGATESGGGGDKAGDVAKAAKTKLSAGGAKLLGSFGLIAAAIVVLVGTIAWATHQAQAAERAVDKAKEAAGELNANLEAAQASYDEFVNDVSAYESAREAINSLTKGTEEYADAVKNANNAAQQLLDTNQNLDYTIQNGQIVIDEQSLENQKIEQQKQLEQAQRAKSAGQTNLKRAEENLQKRDMSRKLSSNADFETSRNNALGATASGAAIGAAIGSVVPVIGTLAGAIGGAIIGGIGGVIANSIVGISDTTENDALEKLEAAYLQDDTVLQKLKSGQMTEADWQALDINDSALRASLEKNADEVAELVQEMANNTKAVDAQNDLVASNALANNKIVQESKYQDQIVDITGDAYGMAYDKAMEADWTETWGKKNIAKIDGANAEAKKVFNEYLKYAGLEDQGYTLTDTTGTDTNRKFVYRDKEGNEHKVSLEAMQAARAAYEASNTLQESAEKLALTFDKLADSVEAGNKGNAGLLSFLSQKNFEAATKEEFSAMQIQADSDKSGGLSNEEIRDYLEKQLGEPLTDSVADDYGYKTADDLIKAFSAKLDNATQAWQNTSVPTGFEYGNALDLTGAKGLEKVYEKYNLGFEYINNLNSFFNKNTDPDNIQKIINALTSVDWTDWDAGKDVIQTLKNYGIEIDESNEAWQKHIQIMRDAANASVDLDALRESIQSIDSLTKDLSLGKILKKEDYETLIGYNDELARYFQILADGSAQLIGDPLDLQQEINSTNQTRLREAIKQNQDNLAEAHSVLSYYNEDKEGMDTSATMAEQAASGLEVLRSQNHESYKELAERFNSETVDLSLLEDIDTAVNTVKENLNADVIALQSAMNDLALSAETPEERQEMLDKGEINEQALGYATMVNHNKEKWEGLETQEVEDYSEIIQEMATHSDLLADSLEGDVEAAEDVALYTMKMNRGIETLADNWEDWSSILKKSDKGSEEYSKTIIGLKKSLSDILGVSEDWISSDFFTEDIWADLEKAAEGDADAIDRLALAASRDILVHLDFENETAKNDALKAHDELAALLPDIKVGMEISANTGEVGTKLAEIVEKSKMTVEEANAYFRSLGFEPTFETETAVTEQSHPIIETTTSPGTPKTIKYQRVGEDGEVEEADLTGLATVQTSTTIGYTKSEQAIEVPALYTTSKDGKKSTKPSFKLTRTNAGAMNNFSSSNAGGKTSSGSKPKKAKRPKKSDVVERYKEINDKLKETGDLMETNNKLADSLWGDERFGKLEEEIDLLKQENEQLEERLEWSKAYLAEDKKALSEATAKAGISFTFDKDGYITNYTTEMTKLHKQLDNATVAANASGGVSDVEQDRIDKIQEKIDAVEDARKAYDGTLDEINSDTQKHLDNQLKIWEDHFELLNEKLEFEVDINDTQLEEIEYYLDKISDKVYEAVDGYELLSQQFVEQEQNYQAQKTYLENLNSAYKNNEIGLTQYKEGLKESQSAILNNLSALEDLKTTMQEYYGDILSMAQEETATFTDQMEHLSSVLDHYSSLMDVLGKEQDYDMKDSLFRGQADTVKNDLEVAKQLYQLYSAEADEWRTKMLAAADGSIEQENYHKHWEAAQEAANEAQENMLSKTEAWAEAMKAVVENELKSLARTLEESLTGGSNFDTLLQDMDRASNLQEEYLTATNQIYETNKLMHQAQQEIDKSTNTVAKKRLAGFIEETQQLQDQSQLSQYELEIQQAKYDLLLAEIALEESQNAKSMVRLQRDNEGNFGYVYTADSGAVVQAEQELIDKQNNLYNIALRGSNDYSQKYMDTLSEMYDTLTDLQTQYLDGAFKDEQAYQDAVTSAKEYYYDKLKQYSSLHQVALTTDSRVIADAWSNDFNDMITKTDEWKDCVDTFADDAAQSLQGWADTVSGLLDESGFNNIDDTVKDIVDNHTDYRDILIGEGGVVDALTSEIEKANELAEANIGVQDSIAGIIAEYEKLLKLTTGEYADKTLENNYLKIPEVDVESIINNVKSNSTNASAESSGGYSSKGASTGGSSGSASKNSTSTSQANQALKNGVERVGEALKDSADILTNFSNAQVASLVGQKIKDSVDSITNLINVKGFASGGYTGAWGPDGKWAVLHEKELILNKHDTENFLASMEVLQRILQIIDLQSTSSQLGGILSTPKFGYNNQGTLEQSVHIEANFPNATNHNEIEEAFGNLVNLASQYANRK